MLIKKNYTPGDSFATGIKRRVAVWAVTLRQWTTWDWFWKSPIWLGKINVCWSV